MKIEAFRTTIGAPSSLVAGSDFMEDVGYFAGHRPMNTNFASHKARS